MPVLSVDRHSGNCKFVADLARQRAALSELDMVRIRRAATADEAGLGGDEVQVITVPPADPSQSGRVVDEQPSAGTRAPTGSTVTIYVGSS